MNLRDNNLTGVAAVFGATVLLLAIIIVSMYVADPLPWIAAIALLTGPVVLQLVGLAKSESLSKDVAKVTAQVKQTATQLDGMLDKKIDTAIADAAENAAAPKKAPKV